jgi:hypothetical protein
MTYPIRVSVLIFYIESVQHISYTSFYICDFVNVYLNHLVIPVPINQTNLCWKKNCHNVDNGGGGNTNDSNNQRQANNLQLGQSSFSFPLELPNCSRLFLATDSACEQCSAASPQVQQLEHEAKHAHLCTNDV